MGGILLLSPVGHGTLVSRDARSATWVLLRAPVIALPLLRGLSCCPGAMGAWPLRWRWLGGTEGTPRCPRLCSQARSACCDLKCHVPARGG